jgi:hypothetical protein
LEEDLEVSADEDVDWRGLVWLTLEELQRFYLIQEYLSQPISSEVQSAGESRVSRRKMIKTATLVGGFALGSMFPLVKSIVAPAPGMAAPGVPIPTSTPTLTSTPTATSTPTPCPKNHSYRATGGTEATEKEAKRVYEIMIGGLKSGCETYCSPCRANFDPGEPSKAEIDADQPKLIYFWSTVTCTCFR